MPRPFQRQTSLAIPQTILQSQRPLDMMQKRLRARMEHHGSRTSTQQWNLPPCAAPMSGDTKVKSMQYIAILDIHTPHAWMDEHSWLSMLGALQETQSLVVSHHQAKRVWDCWQIHLPFRLKPS